ncbi:L,D-transpeptidase family protein, partial [Thermogemmatispora sp.]|uniref:L,D-transpeptidase family protein n=2 Tax=Thermogemmatispora sp. TaxID=1968838 RepID=UPI0026188F97
RWRCWHNLLLFSLFIFLFALSACTGNPAQQQAANQAKAKLDTLIAQARNAGVPETLLSTIQEQEAQLASSRAPLSFFSDQPLIQYYENLTQRYQQLSLQVEGLTAQVTDECDYQAWQDLQTYASVLSERQAQGFAEAQSFQNRLTKLQTSFSQAKLPRDYQQISNQAQQDTQALRLMGTAANQLQALDQIIAQLQASHLDTTALQQLRQADQQRFHTAQTPADFQQLISTVNAQFTQAVVLSTQAIPYVGAAKLKQLSDYIAQAQQYGQDVSTFQQRLTADQHALDQAQTIGDYLQVSSQIDNDISAVQLTVYRGKANYLLQQFHDEVKSWGASHKYHGYELDFEYMDQGIGSDADYLVQTAQTIDDYQAAIDFINRSMTLLRAMEADYNDQTPYDQPHSTDLQLMARYGFMQGEVMVVSLVEQVLRLYNNGQLVRAFYVTTGQYMRPSPPGIYHIFDRESPTIFKSSEPKGSAFWYPDTKINYAMAYRSDGYFIHDSWWRADYGPGTEFPHYDSGGDEEFAGNGSHGCINMQEDEAGWLYHHTTYGTPLIIY